MSLAGPKESLKMKRAFTILELLVAIGLLSAILAASGLVFHEAVSAQRTAKATAEIAQKLHGITDQLNADFGELRKDGEMLMAWIPVTLDPSNSLHVVDYDDYQNDSDGYIRFDMIVFFCNGIFESYHDWPVHNAPTDPDPTGFNMKILKGNKALVCYMLAKNTDGDIAQKQIRTERVLARMQHILISEDIVEDDGTPLDFPDLTVPFDAAAYELGFNNYEFEEIDSVGDWKSIVPSIKADIYSIITGIRVSPSSILDGASITVDPSDPGTIHMLFCEGVGEFKIQFWYDDGVNPGRWFPEIDPINGGDFNLAQINNETNTTYPGFWYPGDGNLVSDLGRAFKFTFTLYDSLGIFKDGKTFTHIVYLD